MTEDEPLIAAFDALMASAPSEPGVGDAIQLVRAALAEPARRQTPEPLPPPLAEAVSVHAHATGAPGAFMGAIHAIVDELVWSVAYADHEEADMQLVRAGYRYTSLVGPEPTARHHHDRVALFVTVQGAGITYPSHVHKASELYVVVGGEGDWQIGDGPFERKEPDRWLWHPSGTRHAMRTHDHPMSALAIWTTDPASPSVIVRA